MNGGPSGFNNAPVTRTFIVASALFTIMFGIKGRSNKLGLSFQDILQNLLPWKLIASVFAFSSTPELMIGLYLLYYFHISERQIGSNKYSVFIVFTVITSFFLEVAALALLKATSIIMEKIHIPGICGILAGFLYHLNIFYVRRAKFPDFVASFFSGFSWPSTLRILSAGTGRNTPTNLPAYAGQQVERNHPVPLAAVEPPEESISTLVSMGFDRNASRQALVHARNDINVATNILLEASSHRHATKLSSIHACSASASTSVINRAQCND